MTSGATRIGVFGGTFDPPHLGHLALAQAAATDLRLDRVLFIPAGVAYHKTGSTSPEHRVTMTRLAVTGNATFAVSTCDVDRPGATYTIDTLRSVSEEYPGSDLVFLLGADSIREMHTWKNIEDCLGLAEFRYAARPGHVGCDPGVEHHLRSGRVAPYDAPLTGLSSTLVRGHVAAGKPARYLSPDLVLDYIDTHRLYRD